MGIKRLLRVWGIPCMCFWGSELNQVARGSSEHGFKKLPNLKRIIFKYIGEIKDHLGPLLDCISCKTFLNIYLNMFLTFYDCFVRTQGLEKHKWLLAGFRLMTILDLLWLAKWDNPEIIVR